VETLSELVQCCSEQPVKRELYYSYSVHSYNEWKETVWLSMKSDCKECGMVIAL
jgi:hypothetical protein